MSEGLSRIGILGHTGRPVVRRVAPALARRLQRQGRTVRLDARPGAHAGKAKDAHQAESAPGYGTQPSPAKPASAGGYR